MGLPQNHRAGVWQGAQTKGKKGHAVCNNAAERRGTSQPLSSNDLPRLLESATEVGKRERGVLTVSVAVGYTGIVAIRVHKIEYSGDKVGRAASRFVSGGTARVREMKRTEPRHRSDVEACLRVKGTR